MTSPQTVKPILAAEKLANSYGISPQELIDILLAIDIPLFIEAPVDNYDIFISSNPVQNNLARSKFAQEIISRLYPVEYTVVTKFTDYLCLSSNDYKLIALKNGIRVNKFFFAGIYQAGSKIKILTPSEFIYTNIKSDPILRFKYFSGYFCARSKDQRKNEGIEMNAESECSIRISFSDLLISPNDMELIIPQLPCRKIKLNPDQDPHISDSLHLINELHREIFGIESNYEHRSLNETKAYIKTRLKDYWLGDKSGLETKIREAVYIVTSTESPTKLDILNQVALECWNRQASSTKKAYPKTKEIVAMLLEFKISKNFATHGATIIHLESEKR